MKPIKPLDIHKWIDVSTNSIHENTLLHIFKQESEYSDNSLKEHMYNMNTIADGIMDSDSVSDTVGEEIEELIRLCDEHAAAYVRFI